MEEENKQLENLNGDTEKQQMISNEHAEQSETDSEKIRLPSRSDSSISSGQVPRVHISTHYETHFGMSLYVLGNLSITGKWRIEKGLRLSWTEGNNWVGSLMESDLQEYPNEISSIEYKYCLAKTANPSADSLIWEEGPNRILLIPKVGPLYLNDVWGHRRVVFRIFEGTKLSDMYLLGNCEEIGTIKSPHKMNLVVKTNEDDLTETVFWEKTLLIKTQSEPIKYTYAKKDSNKMLILDRRPRLLQIKELLSKNELEIHDKEFRSGVVVTQIDENVFLGAYPQSEEDVKILRVQRIRAVLNLQTDNDMAKRGLNTVKLLRFYKRHGIEHFQFPVIDMDLIDMRSKVHEASRLLNFLVMSYKVYQSIRHFFFQPILIQQLESICALHGWSLPISSLRDHISRFFQAHEDRFSNRTSSPTSPLFQNQLVQTLHKYSPIIILTDVNPLINEIGFVDAILKHQPVFPRELAKEGFRESNDGSSPRGGEMHQFEKEGGEDDDEDDYDEEEKNIKQKDVSLIGPRTKILVELPKEQQRI